MTRLPLTLFAAALAAALPAAAAVTVSFPSPTYSDIGPPGFEADSVKNELARHLQALGARHLGPNEDLWIEVLDVDLAGERTGGRYDLRVTRGNADFPRMTLRYKLSSPERSKDGRDDIGDSSYLWFPSRARQPERLEFEKRMLDDWFRQRFAR
jgi:hypothetical protein